MFQNKLLLWQVVFITSLLTSNVIAGKVVLLFGYLTVPAAVLAYALTFLATDVINELYGKETANEIVRIGFLAQLLAAGLIYLATLMPVAPFMPEMQDAFLAVLGQNWRFVLASLTAYAVSQTHDVYAFHYWRRLTKSKHKWIRNNMSTLVSQILDTAIFITIAFWGQVPNLGEMIISQYVVKAVLALIDTPFFYLFTIGSAKRVSPLEEPRSDGMLPSE
ncbi:MAG: queuosine precursor transporter [Firmicutes bacterium]|jgi:uncharacterized integral membrane protein (TIGR00697 family)|nr:queuosine precursor transporter [Bacillota bacterium]